LNPIPNEPIYFLNDDDDLEEESVEDFQVQTESVLKKVIQEEKKSNFTVLSDSCKDTRENQRSIPESTEILSTDNLSGTDVVLQGDLQQLIVSGEDTITFLAEKPPTGKAVHQEKKDIENTRIVSESSTMGKLTQVEEETTFTELSEDSRTSKEESSKFQVSKEMISNKTSDIEQVAFQDISQQSAAGHGTCPVFIEKPQAVSTVDGTPFLLVCKIQGLLSMRFNLVAGIFATNCTNCA